jgi:hypothetical protein
MTSNILPMTSNIPECAICQSDTDDPVSMTCNSQHQFCFKCILKAIETTKKMPPCPSCRGGDRYIILPTKNISTEISENPEEYFYTTKYFKTALPTLQQIFYGSGHSGNSCLIAEQLLLIYALNKKQLRILDILVSAGEKVNDVIHFIKWSFYKENGNRVPMTTIPLTTTFESYVNEGVDSLSDMIFNELSNAGIPANSGFVSALSSFIPGSGNSSTYREPRRVFFDGQRGS